MKKVKYPVTAATRFLKQHKTDYTPHLYPYEDKGGTRVSSEALGVPEHTVIKTLIMEDELKQPIIILMHGDMEVSTKNLARIRNVKTITPCSPEKANKITGYQVGGTSPFGTLKKMDIYAESSIQELDTLILNGGKRGFLIMIKPDVIEKLLSPIWCTVGIKS